MSEEAATEQAERPIAKIIAPKAREITVDLDWPVEFDGTVYDKIKIRRVTGREVEEFVRTLDSRAADSPWPKAPMIDCPIEVYEALDDDDLFKVEEAMNPFLPRRLQRALLSIQEMSGATPAA